MAAGSGVALTTWHGLKLGNDPQRIRHHRDVLLAVSSTPKQTSKLPQLGGSRMADASRPASARHRGIAVLRTF